MSQQTIERADEKAGLKPVIYSHPTLAGNVIDAITANLLWRTDFNEGYLYEYELIDEKKDEGYTIKAWKLSIPSINEDSTIKGISMKVRKGTYKEGNRLPAPTQAQVLKYLDGKGVYVSPFWSIARKVFYVKPLIKTTELADGKNLDGVYVTHESGDYNTCLELGLQAGLKFVLNNNLAH